MHVSDFDFELPERLIAQVPPPNRGDSRLLVLDRHSGAITHTSFQALPDFLRSGDRLVMNDTRVLPARLLGSRVPSGGAVECLLLQPVSSGREVVDWEALMHLGQKLHPGSRVRFEKGDIAIDGEVLARHFHGKRTIRLSTTGDLLTAIEAIGHIPLPPYIRRTDTADDRERYQTVYAHQVGSIAAPTAGLHFTRPLLDAVEARGVHLVRVTLRVGYGTFKPVRVEEVEEHRVDPEPFSVSADAAAELARAKDERQRIVAVGTTTTRVLESLSPDALRAVSGETDLFVRPGHHFRMVDGLITNFHLPRSSLLMLVAAFAGRDHVLAAYREAVEREYRFYSYGDAMLVL
jgi:S-adenosylmethionine:tRNA ribosyltransferase-isomerase